MPPIGRNRQRGFDSLPAGFSILERPGVYSSGLGYVAISWSHTTHNPQQVGGGRALYTDRLQALYDWATANNFELVPIHNHRPVVSCGPSLAFNIHQMVPDRWYVGTRPGDLMATGYTPQPLPAPLPCPVCGVSHPKWTVVCPTTLQFISCPNCGNDNCRVSPEIRVDQRAQLIANAGGFICNSCGSQCGVAGCTELAPGLEYCTTHGTFAACIGCMQRLSWETGHRPDTITEVAPNRYICESCTERLCRECMRVSRRALLNSPRYEHPVCQDCQRNVLRLEVESFDEDASDTLESLRTIPGRETIRNCGIEIEGANGSGGGNELAAVLYRAGLSTTKTMTDHGSGTRYGLVHVEYDSTVDWEAVIGPLNMAASDHVKTLDSVMKAIRSEIKKGTLKLDLRCGLHIHVGAERTSLAKAYNLSHIFTYLEDPFFRIGAAKWPFHRGSQGSNYAAPVPKHSRKLDFYTQQGGRRTPGRENHYYALSFSNYFNSMMRNCACGAAGAGMWDECTCPNLGKCTFEFRLFNTTANMRKLRAYLALSQAMVAKAVSLPEIARPNEEFPGLPFNQRVFKEMEDVEAGELVDAWKPRIAYIFNELPLTTDEKEAVLYCVRNCEIAQGLSDDEIVALANSSTSTTTGREVTA